MAAPAAADTRRQILVSVKEQARLLQELPLEGPLEQGAAVRHAWSQQQWHEAFVFLFVNCAPAGPQEHQDDLLFFVRRTINRHQPTSTAARQQAASPVFVRRKGRALPDDLQLSGAQFPGVDWARSVLLNLVLHAAAYQLTVVACGPEALPFVAQGSTWSPGMIAVTKPVYACTTVTAVNLDSSRAKDSTPAPCYPDICFAVDNFDNAFDDLVLEDASRCYCVVLHALLDQHEQPASADDSDPAQLAARISRQRLDSSDDDGGGGSTVAKQQQHSGHGAAGSRNSSSASGAAAGAAATQPHPPAAGADDGPVPLPPGRNSSVDDGGSSSAASWCISSCCKRTLFAGYVSFAQIATFMESSSSSRAASGGRSLLESLLKGGGAGRLLPQKDKVVMTGPGGVGRCEVAVTKLEVQQQQQQPPGGLARHPGASASSPVLAASNGGGGGSATGVRGAAVPPQQGQQPQQQQRPGSSPAPGAAAVSSAGGQEQQQRAAGAGSSGSSPATPQQQQGRQNLLQRVWHAATGVQQALDGLSDLQQPAGSSSCNMLCALMSLRLPVQHLANELLDAL